MPLDFDFRWNRKSHWCGFEISETSCSSGDSFILRPLGVEFEAAGENRVADCVGPAVAPGTFLPPAGGGSFAAPPVTRADAIVDQARTNQPYASAAAHSFFGKTLFAGFHSRQFHRAVEPLREIGRRRICEINWIGRWRIGKYGLPIQQV